MSHRLAVRVLLDTGPTEDEVRDIRGWFDAVGMDAVCEGHSYGGPPPTSAFLIVVNSPLAPFLDLFAERDSGWHAFEELIGRLQAMRADVRRWGQPHGVKLEDSHSGHTVWLPARLPSAAYQALMGVDPSGFDRHVPPVQVEWSQRLGCWQAALTTEPRRLARRAPQRWRAADSPRVRELTEAELGRLWQLAGHGDTPSVVTLQRARVVLWSALGWNVASIAQRTLMGVPRVRAVIRNFNTDGFGCLWLDYRGGEAAKPTYEEQRDAELVAARAPSNFGLPGTAWDPCRLGEFLVGEGVVEDADLCWLESLLAGLATSSQPAGAALSAPEAAPNDPRDRTPQDQAPQDQA